MEKRRIRLEINGVVCGLITQESEEYMQSLAAEVGKLMTEILEASPFITREAAALTAALSYCDDSKKNGKKAFELQERVDELEVEAEIWQEDKDELLKKAADDAGAALSERLKALESDNTMLTEKAEHLRDIEEKCMRLTDENNALRATARELSENNVEKDELLQRIDELETENTTLHIELDSAKRVIVESENADSATQDEKISALNEENERLRKEVQQAEHERQGAISAAKRAVEEAKRRMDEMERELATVKADAEKYKARAESPALDLLETEVCRPESDKLRAPRQTDGKKRKNPLRYDSGLDQDGFVSFFEKKK